MSCWQLERTGHSVCQATEVCASGTLVSTFTGSECGCPGVRSSQRGRHPEEHRDTEGFPETIRQYAEADLLLSRSLSLTNRVLGHEHPIVAVTMRTIAVFQVMQGNYGEAERFIRRSFEISEKTLGSEHPEVAASRKVFAQVLRPGHRDTEADRADSRAQDMRTRSVCGN